MRIIIRDDDTCFFTQPSELKNIYEKLLGKVRIILGVVPYIKGINQAYIPRINQNNLSYPVGNNKALVKFLKKEISKGNIEIALHGISHVSMGENHEFASNRDLTKEVARSKRYLEKVFDTKINWFIPPHNKIDRLGMQSVINNGLNLMNVPNFLGVRDWWRRNNYLPFAKIIKANLINRTMPTEVLDFGDHQEIFGYALTPSSDIEQIERAMNIARKTNGIICIATHYWEVNKKIIGSRLTLKKYLEKHGLSAG